MNFSAEAQQQPALVLADVDGGVLEAGFRQVRRGAAQGDECPVQLQEPGVVPFRGLGPVQLGPGEGLRILRVRDDGGVPAHALELPDPQDPETFTRSKLDWSEASGGDHARLLELYRALIALRRTTPDLTEPGFEDTAVDVSEDEGWLLLRRGRTEVAMNFSAEARRVPVRGAALALATDDGVRLDPASGAESAAGGAAPATPLHLPGHSAAVLTH